MKPAIQTDERLEEVYDLLRRFGLRSDRAYFLYTAHALYLALEDPDRLLYVTKWLYADVARLYGTNWKTVERSIREGLRIVWDRNRQGLWDVAGYDLPYRPTASHYLTILVEYLNKKEKEQERE